MRQGNLLLRIVGEFTCWLTLFKRFQIIYGRSLWWDKWGEFDSYPGEGKETAMLLFIQHNKLHTYPVASRCSAHYQQEQLRDTAPHDVVRCPYCLNFWPEERLDLGLQRM
jgi:hypothetical protein